MNNYKQENKDQILKEFIKNFIQKDRRERSYFELTNPKKRRLFPDRLNHNWDSVLDMRYLTQIDKESDNPETIQNKLGLKDNELCYVISNYTDYDDKFFAIQRSIYRDLFQRICDNFNQYNCRYFIPGHGTRTRSTTEVYWENSEIIM